ncbi:MAG: RNA pseudouridine synthase [Alphaproteobacteria bacterium CG1_02_46_17]|nr:MAG: RNA pseudouridine synthase [Alphaproteobacteria bacterium CG1_02_46_17]
MHAIIGYEEDGLRLDKAVATLLPDFSRTRLQGLIESGECLVDGQPCLSASRKVKAGEQIVLSLPPLEDATPEPENIPLEIFFEDEDVIVLNKPVGMVVHPAIGHATGTLVNALLYHCGDSLSGINGVRRPGIVHRLDKDTSGLMMVAKNDLAHHHLSEQLQDRSLSRVYQALVFGVPFPHKGRVETLIGRHPSNRLKMAVVKGNGKEAATNFTVLENYNDALALVECRLETGRTHQIRVHMQHLGFPLAGDELYGVQSNKAKSILRKGGYEDDVIDAVMSFPRQALHAAEISFIHPKTEEEMHFTSPLPDDLFRLLEML